MGAGINVQKYDQIFVVKKEAVWQKIGKRSTSKAMCILQG